MPTLYVSNTTYGCLIMHININLWIIKRQHDTLTNIVPSVTFTLNWIRDGRNIQIVMRGFYKKQTAKQYKIIQGISLIFLASLDLLYILGAWCLNGRYSRINMLAFLIIRLNNIMMKSTKHSMLSHPDSIQQKLHHKLQHLC